MPAAPAPAAARPIFDGIVCPACDLPVRPPPPAPNASRSPANGLTFPLQRPTASQFPRDRPERETDVLVFLSSLQLQAGPIFLRRRLPALPAGIESRHPFAGLRAQAARADAGVAGARIPRAPAFRGELNRHPIMPNHSLATQLTRHPGPHSGAAPACFAVRTSPAGFPFAAASRPRHDDIAQCARELWAESGRPSGHDAAIWLEAERRLISARRPPAPPPGPPASLRRS